MQDLPIRNEQTFSYQVKKSRSRRRTNNDYLLHSFSTRYGNLLLRRCVARKAHLREGNQNVKNEKDSPCEEGEIMNWLVIVCIYSYTIGLLLCFYAGMRVERDTKQPKISARVIRPAVITIKSEESRLTKNE